MDENREHPPGWVQFGIKETSVDEEDSPGKIQTNGAQTKTTIPKIDLLSLNEIPLNDEGEKSAENSISNGNVVFTKSNGHANNQKGVAKMQVSSQDAIDSIPTKINGGRLHSSCNNLASNQNNSEVIVGVGQSNGGRVETGKVLTSVYPINLRCAWLTPPEYDPTKMPKILSHENIQLAPATYMDIMKCVTGDIRFNSYCVMYSRVLPVWVMLSILVLLIVLFSSPSGGIPVMVFTFIWMFMLLLGILFCIIIRKHLAIALGQAVKDANKLTFTHKLLVGVQDRGQLSCHKVVILFIYYDEICACQEDVAKLLRVNQANSVAAPSPTSMSEAELGEQAAQLLLQYSQKYVKAYMKKQLLFPTRPIEGVSDFRPKHCAKSFCLCQFIEKSHFSAKQKKTWHNSTIYVGLSASVPENFRYRFNQRTRKLQDVMATESYVQLSLENLCVLLKNDNLGVKSEDQVFAAVRKWIMYDEASRKDHLLQLLEAIRMPMLSTQFLVQTVSTDPIIRAQVKCRDIFEILIFQFLIECFVLRYYDCVKRYCLVTIL